MGIPMKIWHKSMIVMVLAICLFLSGCAKTEIIGGSVEYDKLVDGVYEGSASGGPNKAVVKIAIKDQRIASIEIVEHRAMKGKKAEPIIPQRIIDQQSTNVDAVSGATNSSNVIMNAVQNALEKAYNTLDDDETGKK